MNTPPLRHDPHKRGPDHERTRAARDHTADWLEWIPLLLPLCYLLALSIAMFSLAPIPQPIDYHDFADQREHFDLNNFADVSSNLALLAGGAFGLLMTLRHGVFRTATERHLALTFFAAISLTSLGSTWYHLSPGTDRLFWDRLPLSLAFTALPAMLIAERISLDRASRLTLHAWVLFGPLCVLYWYQGELVGAGDLRPYFLLHVFMLLLPPALLLLRTPYSRGQLYVLAYVLFLVGMLGDWLDDPIFALTHGMISGHTIKHLLTGAATALVGWTVGTRRVEPDRHSGSA